MAADNYKPQPRIVALDYGTRRIGVAVSDILRITAQPGQSLEVRNISDAVNQVKDLMLELKAERIVLGLPKNLSGNLGEMGKEVQAFGLLLSNEIQVPVDFIDEQFTSVQAEKTMHFLNEKPSKNKKKIDSLSAVFILQTFLELEKNTGRGDTSINDDNSDS